MNKQQEPRLRFQGFTGEWEERVLGKIFEISSASRVLKEQWQKEGVPFFRTSDVIAAFKGESNEEAFISFELFEDLAKKSGRPQKDDLLVTGGGSIGIPFLIQNDQPIYFKDADLLWLKSAGKINGSFLFYSFLSNKFKSYLKSISHTGTISHYTIIQAKFTPIALPSLPEQTHLGLFFRRLDSQIAESRAVLEKSRQLKKAMLAKMFPANGEKIPKIRFKGFEGEWETRSLRDVLEIERKGKAQYQKLQTGNVPYLDAEFLNGGVKILTDAVPDVDADDILIIWDGSNAGKVYSGFNGVLGSTLKSYRTNADCSSMFLYQELVRNEEVIFSQYRTPNIPHVIKDFSDEYNFLMPSYKEQTAIGNFFRQLDETIALQAAEVEKLNQLKKGLLAAMLV